MKSELPDPWASSLEFGSGFPLLQRRGSYWERARVARRRFSMEVLGAGLGASGEELEL